MDVLGELAVVLHRFVGLLVAVETDVAHSGNRNKGMQTFDHSESGAKDRHDGKLASRNLIGCHLADRSFDFNVLERDVPGDFITHQKGYFIKEFPEILGSGVLVSHDGKLVLYHRMVDYV